LHISTHTHTHARARARKNDGNVSEVERSRKNVRNNSPPSHMTRVGADAENDSLACRAIGNTTVSGEAAITREAELLAVSLICLDKFR